MSSCSGNCSSCGSSDCGDRKKESLLAKLNPKSTVKKVIAVVSGKGGVGKSTVTSLLAVAMARQGKRVGVLDVDIFNPDMVVVQTELGMLTIKGVDLHIYKLNLEAKELCVEGEISSCTYSDKVSNGGRLLGKILEFISC